MATVRSFASYADEDEQQFSPNQEEQPVKAIICQLVDENLQRRRSELRFDVEEPAGFLVRQSDVRELEAGACLPDLQRLTFADKEGQRASRFRAINKTKGIPFFEERYSLPGRVLQGVACNLKQILNKEAGKRCFVMGIRDDLFATIWDEAGEEATAGDRSRQPDPAALSRRSEWARQLLDLMPDKQDERPGLRNRFKGDDYTCRLVRQLIMRAAEQSDANVLITGERGTGKQIVAELIHELSARKGKPFKQVNCAAIPEHLLESELFGHKRGAFTGAVADKDGVFKLADGGTVFLDEIGEMAPHHQAKILLALQPPKPEPGEDKKDCIVAFTPLGDTKECKVTVRVIAATNRQVRITGRGDRDSFRQDLYDRLSQIRIETPSLRDHLGDLPVIAAEIWRQITNDPNAELCGETVRRLQQVRWEDNVRGLGNALRMLHFLFGTKDSATRLDFVLGPLPWQSEESAPDVPTVPVDLFDVIEVLARASHETWMQKRRAEGWVWGKRRIETKRRKTNPDLKPYEKLTEEQKAYAREESKAVVRALLQSGYTLTKK